MAEQERTVAGLRCSEVMAGLSDYLDGDLSRVEADRVEAHLRGCNWCEKFGDEIGAVIAELRTRLEEPEPVAPEVAARLMAKLRDD